MTADTTQSLLIGALGVFIGALISGLFATLAYMFKRHQDQRVVLNEAFFELMLIWNAVMRLTYRHPERLIDIYIERLQARLPNENIKATEKQKEGLRIISEKIFGSQEITSGTLNKHYNEAVRKTAAVDPLLAFQLFGNDSLSDYLQRLDKIIPTMVAFVSTFDKKLSPDAVETFKSGYRDFISSDVKSAIENDLVALAQASAFPLFGTFSSIKLRHHLDLCTENASESTQELIDEYIENVIVPMVAKENNQK